VVFIDEVHVDSETMSQHLDQRTRARVLSVVSEHGPVTAAEVGRRLGLTAAAVRRHLDALAEQGDVVEHDAIGGQTRGRGRPARAFVVSDAGHESLPADYDGLATQALRYLNDEVGPDAVADFARERVAGLETRYAGQLAAAGTNPAARAGALVTALTADGFAASARPVGAGGLAGVQLCQGHCPVQRVAEEFPALCDAETDAFSRLLGVHVQRLATLAAGHHVCTTFIPTPQVRSPDPGASVASRGASGTPRRPRSLDRTTSRSSKHAAPNQERS